MLACASTHPCPGQLASAALFAREWQGAYSQCKPCSMNASVARGSPPPARTPSSRRRKSSRASRRTVHLVTRKPHHLPRDPLGRSVSPLRAQLSQLAPPRSPMDIRGDVDPRKDSGGSPIARSGLYCMSCLANWVMYVSCQPRRFRDVFEPRLASVSLLPLYQRCARERRAATSS